MKLKVFLKPTKQKMIIPIIFLILLIPAGLFVLEKIDYMNENIDTLIHNTVELIKIRTYEHALNSTEYYAAYIMGMSIGSDGRSCIGSPDIRGCLTFNETAVNEYLSEKYTQLKPLEDINDEIQSKLDSGPTDITEFSFFIGKFNEYFIRFFFPYNVYDIFQLSEKNIKHTCILYEFFPSISVATLDENNQIINETEYNEKMEKFISEHPIGQQEVCQEIKTIEDIEQVPLSSGFFRELPRVSDLLIIATVALLINIFIVYLISCSLIGLIETIRINQIIKNKRKVSK
ncbi:hypothetical protein CL614_02350 [archaeon]|nr:hypothetical protein [archaeon]